MPSGSTSSRVIDWAALVRKAWGPEFYQPDKAYQFSNGREFNATDNNAGGVYSSFGDAIDQETADVASQHYPDLMTEDRGRLLQE